MFFLVYFTSSVFVLLKQVRDYVTPFFARRSRSGTIGGDPICEWAFDITFFLQ
jgi:hypothetical protein